MENLLGLTPFIRAIKEKPLGFCTLYQVDQDADYSNEVNKLNAVAGREGFKISTSQAYIVDAAGLQTNYGIKVTRK